MLESPTRVNKGNGGVANKEVDVARHNIKNRQAASPEFGSSAEELHEAQKAWDAVHCVEPILASHADTNATNTLEKKHLQTTPSPPSTPSLIYTNNSATPATTTKSSSPNHFSSHLSLQLPDEHSDQFLQQQALAEHSQQSWSPQHQGYPQQQRSSYQFQLPLHGNNYQLSGQHQQFAKNGSLSSLVVTGIKVTPTIDFDEAWEYFTRQDMTHVRPTIRPTIERRGVPGLLRGLFGPRKLQAELVAERDLLFCISQTPMCNSEPLHLQMLQTIYRRLTGTRTDCPRYGPHWDIIGFQGSDPATDLRGVGLLGLVQMVALVCGEQSQHLAGDVFALSHDQHSQFPLMVLCLNVTRIALQALREGCLNKECNSRGNVRHVLNEFFAAVLFYIYYIWRTERKSITDSGYLIKDAESYCKSNVRGVLNKLQQHLRSYSSQHFV